MNTIPKCPNCDSTTVQYRYATSTLMGYSQIIKDGEWQGSDPNWHTSHYICCECHHKFYIREQYGKIVDVIDDGEEAVVPVLKVPINKPDSSSITSATIKVDNNVSTRIKYQWQVDIEELQRQMKEVKEALERLEVNMSNGHSDMVETTQM